MLAIFTLAGYYIISNSEIIRVVEANADRASEIIDMTIEEAKPDALDLWLVKLAKKENCGKGIIDVNGKASRGSFCYQDATYKAMSTKYQIYEQYSLTRAIIEDGGYRHWLCSVVTDKKRCPSYTWGKGIGLPPEL